MLFAPGDYSARASRLQGRASPFAKYFDTRGALAAAPGLRRAALASLLLANCRARWRQALDKTKSTNKLGRLAKINLISGRR